MRRSPRCRSDWPVPYRLGAVAVSSYAAAAAIGRSSAWPYAGTPLPRPPLPRPVSPLYRPTIHSLYAQRASREHTGRSRRSPILAGSAGPVQNHAIWLRIEIFRGPSWNSKLVGRRVRSRVFLGVGSESPAPSQERLVITADSTFFLAPDAEGRITRSAGMDTDNLGYWRRVAAVINDSSCKHAAKLFSGSFSLGTKIT